MSYIQQLLLKTVELLCSSLNVLVFISNNPYLKVGIKTPLNIIIITQTINIIIIYKYKRRFEKILNSKNCQINRVLIYDT